MGPAIASDSAAGRLSVLASKLALPGTGPVDAGGLAPGAGRSATLIRGLKLSLRGIPSISANGSAECQCAFCLKHQQSQPRFGGTGTVGKPLFHRSLSRRAQGLLREVASLKRAAILQNVTQLKNYGS
jgi:hypothetical protein